MRPHLSALRPPAVSAKLLKRSGWMCGVGEHPNLAGLGISAVPLLPPCPVPCPEELCATGALQAGQHGGASGCGISEEAEVEETSWSSSRHVYVAGCLSGEQGPHLSRNSKNPAWKVNFWVSV